MEVAILIFDRLTALDAGSLALVADYQLDEVTSPDVIVVPGGPGQMALMNDEPVLNWIRQTHQTSRWTTSVCTGSLILGAAGLLKGLRATTHWLALDILRSLGAEAVSERVVIEGKIITAAGVSAGIDMALMLVAREAGEAAAQAIQLGIEYDPQPPFNAGSAAKAPPEIVELL